VQEVRPISVQEHITHEELPSTSYCKLVEQSFDKTEKKRLLIAKTGNQLEFLTKTRRLTVDTAAVKKVKYRELQGFELLQ
jgi:hypothetical protein